MGKDTPEISAILKPDWQLSAAKPIYGSFKRDGAKRNLRWDMHYGLEFGLICAGEQRRYFPGRYQCALGPGQVWLCNMWEPHGFAVTHPPCERINLFIWPPMLASLHFDENPDFQGLAPFTVPPKLRPQAPPHLRQTMLDYGGRLRAILKDHSPYQSSLLRLVFLEMLLKLCETRRENKEWRVPRPADRVARINKALKLVFESPRFVSTDEAARVCGMERHAFSVLFEAWMNIPFTDFSLRYRLSAAAEKLIITNDPIKAVARRYGFADASHFCHAFERYYNASPKIYREAPRGTCPA